jgi:hypothetical protein
MHERGVLRVVDVVEVCQCNVGLLCSLVCLFCLYIGSLLTLDTLVQLANAFALGDWVRVGYVSNDAVAVAKGERSVQVAVYVPQI